MLRFNPAHVADHLLGYDFFITYAIQDGIDYPKELADALRQMGYRVCLDSGTETQLRQSTQRQIKKSTHLLTTSSVPPKRGSVDGPTPMISAATEPPTPS